MRSDFSLKKIDCAHRSHSTREAKQNKTKKNQGSPIKTIKSHDSILVSLLGRGVFTAGFAHHSLYLPTNVWEAQDHESLVWLNVVG